MYEHSPHGAFGHAQTVLLLLLLPLVLLVFKVVEEEEDGELSSTSLSGEERAEKEQDERKGLVITQEHRRPQTLVTLILPDITHIRQIFAPQFAN